MKLTALLTIALLVSLSLAAILALGGCGSADDKLEYLPSSYDNSKCSTAVVTGYMERLQVASENYEAATKQLTRTHHWYFVNGDTKTTSQDTLAQRREEYKIAKEEYVSALTQTGRCYD